MHSKLRVAIHWNRFGPYHIARLKAAYEKLQTVNIELVGIETACFDRTYAWKPVQDATPFERHVIFPHDSIEELASTSLFFKAWQIANRVNPDVVAIAGYYSFDCYGFLAWARMHKRPVIMMSESKHDDQLRTAWKEGIKRVVLKQCKSALCGGSPHKEYLQTLGMSPNQITLGYDAVDNNYFEKNAKLIKEYPQQASHLPGLDDPSPFFLASSRFIRRKNLHGLLEAYQMYRTLCGDQYGKFDPWRLIILGDGEERKTLEDIIQAKNLQGVTLPGFMQIGELPSYYGLANAFIHPAFQEQWGLVVNEAMASGLPVIVSRPTGCVRDLVTEGQTGFVFDPKNHSELAKLMLRFTKDEVDLEAIGQAAQAHIALWGPKRFGDGLYNSLKVALASTPKYHQASYALSDLDQEV
jgi:glycosyltransferase involved in cell wall biosynthesis